MLLKRWDKFLGHEGLELCWRSVLGGPRFEGSHVPGVQRNAHLEHKSDEIFGHSSLQQSRSNLIVRSLNISEIGFADGFANNGGDFFVIEIALSLSCR